MLYDSTEEMKGAEMLMAMVKHFCIQGSCRSFVISQRQQECMGRSSGNFSQGPYKPQLNSSTTNVLHPA